MDITKLNDDFENELEIENDNNLEFLRNIDTNEIFYDCEEKVEDDNDNLFLQRNIEFDNFIRELKKDDFLEEEDEIKKAEEIRKKEEKEILKQIKAIEKRMKKKDNEKNEARKRRGIKNMDNNIKSINKKLGEAVYMYNGREYKAYHNNEGKIVFNGIIYNDIKEWLRLCFLVNIGK